MAGVHLWQVEGVDGMFQALSTDIEALFMTGPSVDLGALSTELQNMQAHVSKEVRHPCAPHHRADFLSCNACTGGTSNDHTGSSQACPTVAQSHEACRRMRHLCCPPSLALRPLILNECLLSPSLSGKRQEPCLTTGIHEC